MDRKVSPRKVSQSPTIPLKKDGKRKFDIESLIEEGPLAVNSSNSTELGLDEKLQQEATEQIAKDKDKWVEFMMKHELGLEQPDPKRATKSALNIGLSYIAGGIIPLSPYFFIDHAPDALKYSVIATLICLFVFGYFKSKITGINPWWGALRVTAIGAMAAAAAFGVAKLFEH